MHTCMYAPVPTIGVLADQITASIECRHQLPYVSVHQRGVCIKGCQQLTRDSKTDCAGSHIR